MSEPFQHEIAITIPADEIENYPPEFAGLVLLMSKAQNPTKYSLLGESEMIMILVNSEEPPIPLSDEEQTTLRELGWSQDEHTGQWRCYT